MGISRFFVERPIFAWVIAIVIMLGGIAGLRALPIAQYPDVAPPTIAINATYPGASAETLETSVTQVIEQQLTGIDGLQYFQSSSDSSGSASITVTFEKGTDPDTAQVQVQNKVQQATARLPSAVTAQGVTVTKSNSDFLLIVALYDKTNKASASDIADYLVSNFQDDLARVEGVGQSQVFGSQYAMRVWLDPTKLAAVQLMPSDVQSAIEAQNVDVAAGQVGAQPAVKGQMLNATVRAKSRLSTPEQFRQIVLKTTSNGSIVRLADVARVELGQDSYTTSAQLDGHPASGMAIQLATGADALETATAVKARMAELATNMPAGYAIAYPRDTTTFVKLSVEEVIETLAIAIVLVIVVMFVFLQNWRATLIPAVAVPVVLLGTFGVLSVFGYSINTLTLFAMVLAIGLLVDDAIVVVENVERVMADEKLDPKAATIRSMGEIGSALVGVALVLSAVFLPMAFFGGSTGVIYRQFSITIVSAMLLSVLVALVLTPAMTATLLKPVHGDPLERRGVFGRFNRWFDRTTQRYVAGTRAVIGRRWLHLGVVGVITIVLAILFVRLPTSFLPTEDQGQVMVMYTLPAGATNERTEAVRDKIQAYYSTKEKATVANAFSITGFGFSGSGQNAGMAFASLAPFEDRKKADQSADALNGRAMKEFGTIRDATVIPLTPPAISGLGQSNGFTFELTNTSGLSRDAFVALRDKLIAAANKDPKLARVRASTLPDTPQLRVTLDDAKLAVLGLTEANVTNVLSSAWGGVYVNDFVDRGRVKRVYMQSDAPYRMLPDDLDGWFIRTADGTMAPFSSIATLSWEKGPNSVARFNGRSSYEIQGEPAAGGSSGAAMTEMVKLQKELAPGTGYAWAGLSFQEQQASGQAPMLYGLSVLIVFLCLAALYESWSVPIAVLLVLPLGIIGAVLAVTLRGLDNDIYFQVGLITTIGLAAKNAILIVEFAEEARRAGKDVVDAALEAARTRLRPILMTSLAFIFGVFPLAVASGAGANSRIAIGTAVIGGMLTATVLAIFYVPLFFVVVAKLFHGRKETAA
ncbi:efflux RND transporter permease subunit [Sphingomonas prati]|uniref:Efflux pump membrane transporter n=1 Tax=Sphingomonas prati TaxID=1843237 RepID=A0A7W9BUG6_9SPHN|nr:efflux RND transporter permease subunit [Sphingomonas prati]MBB5730327.1 multidrug efflux pump [Sphingomonas prati]GGE93242.1 multidrug efflux RND transporter permease subunit [Sphingomonas prati]